MSIQFVFTIPIILYDLLTIGETYMIRHKIVTLQARQAGTQTYKTTCFPFRKAGGFFCLLCRRVRLDFYPNPASAIDERQFSCYNKAYLSEKEASCMGEGPKKQQISAGLLAHV